MAGVTSYTASFMYIYVTAWREMISGLFTSCRHHWEEGYYTPVDFFGGCIFVILRVLKESFCINIYILYNGSTNSYRVDSVCVSADMSVFSVYM